jgi:hypothetical protein
VEYGSKKVIAGWGYHLRTKAATIPPAISPTALAVMPIPIKPSAFKECVHNSLIHLMLMEPQNKRKNTIPLPLAI